MTTLPPPRPPAEIASLVKVLGQDEAVRFLLRFGGAEMYFARDPKGRSDLAKEFGIETARKLGRRAHEENWPNRVPLAKKWIARVLLTQGHPVAEIARRLHMSDTTVRSWTKTQRDSRQLSLFND